MAKATGGSIMAPKGTRDLYPEDLLRQRYITEAWRRVSIRHGFEEIAGPTFEMLDLYKKKSGEGIVSELFSFRRSGGEDDYALRPEFTPTLARMYAARAASLPSPCKWFTAGPYFRAEKPQRGRLREFLQWNCDVMGMESCIADAEILVVIEDLVGHLGMPVDSLGFRISDRKVVERALLESGVEKSDIPKAFLFLDRMWKMPEQEWTKALGDAGLPISIAQTVENWATTMILIGGPMIKNPVQPPNQPYVPDSIRDIANLLASKGSAEFYSIDLTIVRGLAYYTGTVFELIADGERAVAGGGRYDNLIELFGGPPTPAVGFGMGDVVLGLLLEDKGLMPEGAALMEALSRRPASLRPEVFVVASEAGEAQVEPLLARLRRGVESEAWRERGGRPWDADRYCSKSGGVEPMHARRSYKATKNVGKLLAEARKQHARFAVIVEDGERAKVEDLDRREDVGTFGLDEVGARVGERL